MEKQVRKLLDRLENVEALLSQDQAIADQKQFRALAQEHAYLAEIKEMWQKCESLQKQIVDSQTLLKQESDPAFLEIIREDIAQLETALAEAEKSLENLLVPPDPRDSRNIILELRAGTG